MCAKAHASVVFSPTRGFTLIELLVVVAIIALLISILLPSLQNAREQSRAAVCLTRQKALGLAMHTFTVEHQGYYPDANYWFYRYGAPGQPGRFGEDPRSRAANSYDPPERGGFFDAPFGPNHTGYFARYMGRGIRAFLCPADDGYRAYKRFWDIAPAYPYFAAMPPRLSYMMNGDLWFLTGLKEKKIQGRSVWYQDDILLQSPARVMLLAEESPYAPMNDTWVQWRGYLNSTDPKIERGWGGRLAERHHKRGTIMLFDGHAELLLAREKWNGSAEWEKTNPQGNRDANHNSGLLYDSLYTYRAGMGGTLYYYVRQKIYKDPVRDQRY
jgi:prepilin-type N-terminal cleavage/methylation domain-containing protein